MTIFSKAFYVVVSVTALLRGLGPRDLAFKTRALLSPFRTEEAQNRVDWRIWLLFWTVFFIGCVMAVLAASSGERHSEGLLIIK